MELTTVILAAGQGTRMKTSLPKVLHRLVGRPLIDYSLRIAAGLSDELPVVVIGHGAEIVREWVGGRALFAQQARQLGTAHAVQASETLLAGKTGLVVVISADMPLLSVATLKKLVEIQKANTGPFSMLTVHSPDSHGFGRVLRGTEGGVRAIIEEAHATAEQLAIDELNVGAYCFDAGWLWPALRRVPVSPKGEYYLTDLVGIAVQDDLRVEALAVPDPVEAIGINTRIHLAEAEAILRRRINERWMLEGVTMVDPQSVYIDLAVQIGPDSVIYPNTHLLGATTIGEGCCLGPNSIIRDSTIGRDCTVLASVLENAVLNDGEKVGPFSEHHSLAEPVKRIESKRGTGE